MILIGQYDSPFVRRVGIALELGGYHFDHRPWSVAGDAERLRVINPLVRVPVLVLDDGEALVETFAILDHLETTMPPERRLWPMEPADRRRTMQVAAIAGGLSDKAVALFYELHFHDAPSEPYVQRMRGQIAGAIDLLENRAGMATGDWFASGRMTHADIAVACAMRHCLEAHPDLGPLDRWPVLARHCAGMETLPAFRKISQPFVPPA